MRTAVNCVWFAFMALLMLAAGCGTVLAQEDGSGILTVLMLPGLWSSLPVTGGHGGTAAREAAGTVVAVGVNMFVVAMPFLLIALLFRKLGSEPGRH